MLHEKAQPASGGLLRRSSYNWLAKEATSSDACLGCLLTCWSPEGGWRLGLLLADGPASLIIQVARRAIERVHGAGWRSRFVAADADSRAAAHLPRPAPLAH